SLAYIVTRNRVSNLRAQPVEDGETFALTDFTSGDIYNFDFSSDGSRLFVARGYSARNAVLIKGFR
ncbi:MAG TPA: hypothetical protein VNA17_10090, partial [Pyrinomonadaceae bacterium]|nr:hypothetical protein [Pyrinomonadaceae bacterium]